MKIAVVVHPKSKRPRIEKDALGVLHVYTAALPVENKANEAVKSELSKYFGIAKSNISLARGRVSKYKFFEVVL